MALETLVENTATFSMGKMAQGEQKSGYIVGVSYDKSEKYGNMQANLIVMNAETGAKEKWFTTGQAKYFAEDLAAATGVISAETKKPENIEKAKKALNRFVVFTRGGDRPNKRGQNIREFTIQVDTEKTYSPEAKKSIDDITF